MIKTWFLILFIILSINISACSKKNEGQPSIEPRLVKAMIIQATDSAAIRIYPGRVDASDKVNLAFLVSGRLIDLPVREGQLVKKGQLIGRIDPKEYEIKVAQEKAKFENAKINFERAKKLLPSGAISVALYDERKALYELAKANLDEVQKNLDDTQLYAPFNGVIANKHVNNYQYVEARKPIVDLQNILDLEIIINVPEEDILRRGGGQQVSRKLEELADTAKTQKIIAHASFIGIPNQSFPLIIKQVQTSADPETQTYKITFLMPTPEKYTILPGMTASVKISFAGKTSENIYLVPVESVAINSDGKSYVWLIDGKKMEVKKVVVQTGDMQSDKIQILAGLKPGDQIVVTGISGLQDGAKVQIVSGRIGH